MAQPVLLRLSAAEWMLCVMTVQPDAAPVLAEAVNRTMTPERLQGALLAAHDVLLARDLARLNDSGKLDINPLVRLCARVVLNPRASFGVTLVENDGSSRVVFYNWLPGFAAGTWVDASQIRSFELLADPDVPQTIAERLLAQWNSDTDKVEAAQPAESKTYSILAANLPALPVEKAASVIGLAATLVRGGMPAADAAALEHAFATPGRRAIVAAAGGAGTPTRTLVWMASAGRSWLIEQASGAASVSITGANTTGLAQAVTAFVRDILAGARTS